MSQIEGIESEGAIMNYSIRIDLEHTTMKDSFVNKMFAIIGASINKKIRTGQQNYG